MRTLVLGDIHGAHLALLQVLDRCGLTDEDRVIFLGDVCDGWYNTVECIEELRKLGKRLTALMGNHDDWLSDYFRTRATPRVWVDQGGRATIQSYSGRLDRSELIHAHAAFLDTWKLWHEENGRVFVHGGWPVQDRHPMVCGPETLMWDRTMWEDAQRLARLGPTGSKLTKFDEVYIGHTTTENMKDVPDGPVRRCEVWNLDQGAGWGGRLSIMDVDTKEF